MQAIIWGILKKILLVNLGQSFAEFAVKKLFVLAGRYLSKRTKNTVDDEFVAEMEKRLK